jgi:hypothetical protein
MKNFFPKASAVKDGQTAAAQMQLYFRQGSDKP